MSSRKDIFLNSILIIHSSLYNMSFSEPSMDFVEFLVFYVNVTISRISLQEFRISS